MAFDDDDADTIRLRSRCFCLCHSPSIPFIRYASCWLEALASPCAGHCRSIFSFNFFHHVKISHCLREKALPRAILSARLPLLYDIGISFSGRTCRCYAFRQAHSFFASREDARCTSSSFSVASASHASLIFVARPPPCRFAY